MKYKLEIYEKGREYVKSMTLFVSEEDRHDLERILLENGCSFRVSAADEDDF